MTKSEKYPIRIDGNPYLADDPVLTGAQLLELAGRRPPNDWTIVVVRPGGCESLRPTESTDLRKPGVEEFVTHQSDRVFNFVLDGVKHEWAAPAIEAEWLRKIAGIDDDGQIFATGNGVERLIDRRERVDLNGNGVEQFRSVPAIAIMVNMKPATIHGRSVTFDQIVAIAVANGLLSGPNVVYTMTYRKGPGDHPEGVMVQNQSITIRKGMVFSVTATDKS